MKSSMYQILSFLTLYLLALPLQAVEADPKPDPDFPPAIVELTIPSAGQRMPALMYLANGPGPHPTVLLLHGFPGNEKNLDIAQDLRRNGFNVLFFHYRGAWGADGEYRILNLADDVVAKHGKINLLFNNAGITLSKTFEHHSLADWEKIIGINLWGVIYGCHFFLPHLRKQAGEAHIVNLSSMVAFVGPPSQTSYSTTKAAIKGFSESLWAEVHDEGIGVTVVHPGAIKTAIMDEAAASTDDPEAFAKIQTMVEKFAMPPEKAAKKILKAVRKDKMRVVVGADALFFEGAKRALPEHIHKLFNLG